MQEQGKPFTYPDVGKTREAFRAAGFDNDYNTQVLGSGEAVWLRAKQAVQAWAMFPGGWAYIYPETPAIRPGETVAMVARVVGLWWINSCRIVYVIDEENRFGFAYGTLPGHVECGEELFLVERLPNGDVQYVLKAFSKPRFWLARLAYPLARWYQRKFVRASKRGVLGIVRRSAL